MPAVRREIQGRNRRNIQVRGGASLPFLKNTAPTAHTCRSRPSSECHSRSMPKAFLQRSATFTPRDSRLYTGPPGFTHCVPPVSIAHCSQERQGPEPAITQPLFRDRRSEPTSTFPARLKNWVRYLSSEARSPKCRASNRTQITLAFRAPST